MENQNVLLSVSGNCRMQWMYPRWSLWKTARCCCHAGFIGLCYKRNFCGNYYFKTGRSRDSASSQSHDYTEFIYYNYQMPTLAKKTIIARIQETLSEKDCFFLNLIPLLAQTLCQKQLSGTVLKMNLPPKLQLSAFFPQKMKISEAS